ncbi:C45 family autoproteolytic acyltransferase/hydolase [Aestuariivirga sp.]|uniref:C45 family autoproteolytic acyltransferase/hydolase n=1 Tax=Aestuariivirga sp. TaxID=2650926 RepID=UPI0039E532CA
MTREFRSTAGTPFERGLEFGTANREQIARNIGIYRARFDTLAGGSFNVIPAGQQALAATQDFAPELHAEMLGLAEGAAVEPAIIGALNARTEILAMLKAPQRGECSAVIYLPHDGGPPRAAQTWDWAYVSRDSWLVWEIPLADGSTTKTMTEYGIVGKAGLNTKGLGLLFTILHHQADGQRIGVPVHIAARAALDGGRTLAAAAQILVRAAVSASSSINLMSFEGGTGMAMTVELYPGGPGFVLPEANGVLVHTNHFLAPEPARCDTEPKLFPDTLLRRDILMRSLARMNDPSTEDILRVMASHVGQDGAVCCHHNPAIPIGEQYETLSTVIPDVASGTLRVLDGGPCHHVKEHHKLSRVAAE